MADIQIAGTLRSGSADRKIALSSEIYDDNLGKFQDEINEGVVRNEDGEIRILSNDSGFSIKLTEEDRLEINKINSDIDNYSYTFPQKSGSLILDSDIEDLRNEISTIPSSSLKKITYSDLVDLSKNSKLIPGMKYRIIDYVTTTSQENTESRGYQFDIIVKALTEYTLDENAKVSYHDFEDPGENNFIGKRINAWEIKYCLDNDTSRFAWADTENGKGVIYYMKDEYGNECPYDFKNIRFNIGEKYFYTFFINSFDATNPSLSKKPTCYFNKILPHIENGIQYLNFIALDSSTKCYNNFFDLNCYNILLGDNSINNYFGKSCVDIYFLKERLGNNKYTDCLKNNISNIVFGNNIQGCDIICELDGYLNNVIFKGIGINTDKLEIIIPTVDQDYEVKVMKNSRGFIKIYCEADLIWDTTDDGSGSESSAQVIENTLVVTNADYNNETVSLNSEVNTEEEILYFN